MDGFRVVMSMLLAVLATVAGALVLSAMPDVLRFAAANTGTFIGVIALFCGSFLAAYRITDF